MPVPRGFPDNDAIDNMAIPMGSVWINWTLLNPYKFSQIFGVWVKQVPLVDNDNAWYKALEACQSKYYRDNYT